MKITPNFTSANNVSMTANKNDRTRKLETTNLLTRLSTNPKATIPAYNLMRGVNPVQNDVFDTIDRIYERKKEIGFARTADEEAVCIVDELEEFKEAREIYEKDKTRGNYYHMCDEMGDVFSTAVNLAKGAGVEPKEAFEIMNKKVYNRINLMERLIEKDGINSGKFLRSSTYDEKLAYWKTAKGMIYDAIDKG
ncbi:MAG: MazG nucleotide pyrophosphohydrolase domain-containing protein [Candidatus Gastranaerophilales bacterium]